MATDKRILALRRVKDPEKRTRMAATIAHEAAEAATPLRVERNRAALYAVYGPSKQRQKDLLEILDITRRAWKVLDRRWAREHTVCPECKAQPGEKCEGVPKRPAESIHGARSVAHEQQIAEQARKASKVDQVALASEKAEEVLHLKEVEDQALEIRDVGLRTLYEMRDDAGAPVYQPSDLARIADVTTSRIGHMGLLAQRPTPSAA